MTFSFELDDKEKQLVEAYAENTGQDIEDLAKRVLIEYVMDAEAADKAWAEYEADPVTYTHEEVGRMLGFVK